MIGWKVCVGNRGSVSIYWVIVIFLVLELILFALNIGSKNFLLASSKQGFQEDSIYIENLGEQSKYLAYKLIEDTAMYAKNYTEYIIDTLDRELTCQEIEDIYHESLRLYSTRRLKLTNERGDSMVGSREELRLQGYPEGYELGERNIRVKIIEKVEVDDRTKRFKALYEYCEKDSEEEYLSTPIVLELSYPSYDEVVSGELGEGVRLYTANNYEY